MYVTGADPEGTFALSQPVEQLDFFISHAWRTGRVSKYICLLFYFNFWTAVAAYFVAAYVAFWFATICFDYVPDALISEPAISPFDATLLRSMSFCSIAAMLAMVAVLFTAHRWRRHSCFLDVCCIDQVDAAKKAKGISSLGALLDRSERMVVVLDEHWMTRTWCIFELAAFAKRGDMARCDLVPLHLAIQRAALTLIVVVFPLLQMTLVPLMNRLDEQNIFVVLPLFAVALAPPYAALLYAINQGRASRLALQRLRHFRLEDVQCFSASDREAIISLIGAWFADASMMLDGGADLDAQRKQALGVHRFEQFIRRDVVAKLQATLGRDNSAVTWPADFSLLFFMALGGAWSLDMATVPEFSLWLLLPLTSQCVTIYLVGAPLFGWGAARAADAVHHAQSVWRWGALAAYAACGMPIVVVFFGLALLSTGVTNPYLLVFGSDMGIAQHRYPEDGLEPFGRAMFKVQLVTLIYGAAAGLVHAQRPRG